jgi:hypothetical protein
MFGGKTPVITQAQIAAIITFIVAQVVAFGWVDGAQAQVMISAGGTLVAVAWKLADAFLRGSRAKAVGAQILD